MSNVEEIRERRERGYSFVEGRRKALGDIDRLLEIADAAADLFDGDGSYAGSVAETIEQVFRKHGSELGQQVVNHHLSRLRDALEPDHD